MQFLEKMSFFSEDSGGTSLLQKLPDCQGIEYARNHDFWWQRVRCRIDSGAQRATLAGDPIESEQWKAELLKRGVLAAFVSPNTAFVQSVRKKLPTNVLFLGITFRKSYQYRYRSIIQFSINKVTDAYSYRPVPPWPSLLLPKSFQS